VTWLEVMLAAGFPVSEWRSSETPWERWCELAVWHERLRRKWYKCDQL
jgi:hypothetical protein